MSEYALHGSSSTLYIPDDMIEQNEVHRPTYEPPPAVSVQPRSLRSLANFTKSPPISSSPPLEERTISFEPELQHNATTFVALESDLGALFGPSAITTHPRDSSSKLQYVSTSFSRSEYEEEIAELKKREVELMHDLSECKGREARCRQEVAKLQSTVEQLELDNIDLSEGLDRLTKENTRLQEDSELQVQDIRSTMQDLKMNLKEKEEDLMRTEQGRSLLLSKVGSHDSVKEENAKLARELADKSSEVARLQSQASSSAGMVSQLQRDLDGVSADLAACQMEVERRRGEAEGRRKECESLRDALSQQKMDMDREFNRQENKMRDMEAEIRRLEDMSRVLQVDGHDRSHSEGRLKAELAAADHRVQQLEADTSALRRRVLDISEAKDRELSHATASNASFESANRVLTDEVNQLRRSVAQLQAAAAVLPPPQPASYSSQAPPMHHHPSHSYQPSPQLPPPQVAHYHTPPPLQPQPAPSSSFSSQSHSQSQSQYRDVYPPDVRAKKDAEFPARHASSLDYNSQREAEIRRTAGSNPPARYPPTPAVVTGSDRAKQDAQFPASQASSLDYNSRRENEGMRSSSATNELQSSSSSSRYSLPSSHRPPSRYQQEQEREQEQEQEREREQSRRASSGGRSLRGYADTHNTSRHDPSNASHSSASAPSGSTAPPSVRSLASLVAGGGASAPPPPSGKRGAAQHSSSPFATSVTASHIQTFDDLETQLTAFMTEKTNLSQEIERLHQRGGKTLKDRTRFVQVEARMDELSKDIARTRKELTQKPS